MKRMKASAAVLGMALGAAAMSLAGCASHTKTPSAIAQPAVNTVCPVMDHEIHGDGPKTMHKGQVVAFCCDDCVPEWESWSEATKDAALAKALSRK